MITRETAYQKIAGLIERFEEQYESYKRADYNETLTRRDFIDPFFKALGWDVDNEQGYAEAYREVIHEDRVKIGHATKAPDYSFRLPGGKRLFFVEAKKPSVVVKDDIYPAYQVRRYGWSAKLPVSIITDFEEFAVYDCIKKPNPTDKASVARIKYLTFKDYLNEFDFLWDTFSKEKVLKGSFDKFVQGTTNKKGTATVDREFLESLDKWRTYLATSISLQNKLLDEDEINFAVQQTIDRIIFLRIAEDRSIEPYGNLRTAVKQGDLYQNLITLFREADQKYNSGLFDFGKDRITEGLKVDNKVIRTIVNELYYPESPYEFSVLSVEILGSAYEQFLGKTISIDKSHHARIEEKPEVRKAGGVYYTPQYIVEYIVQNTVGKLIEGKSPEEVSKLRFVDPACGSGSFLIGAYQYLLEWHKNYYTANPSKNRKNPPLTPDGLLSTAEKKRILLNNIYGVDIDVNAVEVTKLSLLLKCMEGETQASISQQLSMFNERVLPTLDNNIKSGNSLIDLDFYDTQLDFGEEKKVRPFSWKKAFPEVFANGGFDAVIGNPPYVRQELLGEFKPYYQSHYSVFHGMADLYSYFIEKGLKLLKSSGIFGVIVANKWMRANYGEPLRKFLKNQSIYEIIDFGDLPVFESATTYPCILLAGPSHFSNTRFPLTNVKSLQFDSLSVYIAENQQEIAKSSLDDSGWNLAGEAEQKLLEKIRNAGVPLGEYVKGKIFYGIKTGLNEAFVIDEATKNRLIEEDPRSAELIKPFLAGKDIKRYQPPKSNKYLIFTRRGVQIENYPAIFNHLLQYKTQLMPKPKDWKGENWEGRKPGSYQWYEIQDAVDYYGEFDPIKIVLPDIALRLQASLDFNHNYLTNTAYIISSSKSYLLAVLNSNLTQYFYAKISSSIRGGYLRFIRQYLETIRIKEDDKYTPMIETSVEQLVSFYQDLSSTTLSTRRDQIQSKIDYYEDRINRLVYELYGLTEEEIAIVEGSAGVR